MADRKLARSLRAGTQLIYFQHKHVGNFIRVEKLECEAKEGIATVCFFVKADGGHQALDEELLHSTPLEYIEIDDQHSIKGLRSYLQSMRQEVSRWRLQILSRGKVLVFSVTIEIGPLNSLRLVVDPQGPI